MSGGFLTPKAIGNRIKAKGLQKLRWWCQLCEKQCRDENGFKQHATSEGHLRNMQMYSSNPKQFQERFSLEFKNTFLRELGRRHSTNKVKANSFYADYIKDKEHTHMNSTRWRSLTEFIMDLSREGLVRAEDTEKGWFITWIDRSPGAAVSDAERKVIREKNELDDAELDRQRTMAQLAAARKSGGGVTQHAHATELNREAGELGFSLGLKEEEAAPEEEANSNDKKRPLDDFGDDDDNVQAAMPKKPLSNLEAIAMREMEKHKRVKTEPAIAAPAPPLPPPAAAGSAEGWLVPGLVVKVMNKKLEGGAYYKRKGLVFEVHNGGTVGDVEMLDESKDAIRVPAALLETVIPQVGGTVRVVQGPHRGQTGTLQALKIEQFAADVLLSGKMLVSLPYEHICKQMK
jgi:DNA/RNA-binding protein KIN17